MGLPLHILMVAMLVMGAVPVTSLARGSHGEEAHWRFAQKDERGRDEVSEKKRERIRDQIREERQRSGRGDGDAQHSRRLSDDERERLRRQIHEVRERRHERKNRRGPDSDDR